MNLPDHINPTAVDDALLNIGMTINEIRALTGDPAPQIIHTVEELEALDGPVWVMCRDSIPIAAGQLIRAIREYGPRHYLPAVVVLTDTQARAAREALEEA